LVHYSISIYTLRHWMHIPATVDRSGADHANSVSWKSGLDARYTKRVSRKSGLGRHIQCCLSEAKKTLQYFMSPSCEQDLTAWDYFMFYMDGSIELKSFILYIYIYTYVQLFLVGFWVNLSAFLCWQSGICFLLREEF
jgi:hypothetical protein